MKFGRYLKDNQTPEWKRAYIDYSACKKSIKVISRRLGNDKEHKAGEEHKDSSDGDDDDYGPSRQPRKSPNTLNGSGKGSAGLRTPRSPGSRLTKTPATFQSVDGVLGQSSTSRGRGISSPLAIKRGESPPPPLDLGEPSVPKDSELRGAPEVGSSSQRRPGAVSFPSGYGGNIIEQSSEEGDSFHHHTPPEDPETSDSGRALTSPGIIKSKSILSPRLGKIPKTPKSPWLGGNQKGSNRSPQIGRKSIRSLTLNSPRPNRAYANTVEELYQSLEDDEKAFFDLLDQQLDKVSTFYQAREEEAKSRAHELEGQLKELAEHRKIYHEQYPNGLTGIILPPAGVMGLTKAADKLRHRLPFGDDQATVHDISRNGNRQGLADQDPHKPPLQNGASYRSNGRASPMGIRTAYNPERYQQYKRDLRAAVLEFYRHLERIKNYRILNLTGFRKALKKFEKITKIHCMELYTDEKISKEGFAKGDVIDGLLEKMEDLYSEHFEHGDGKKAKDRLRRQSDMKTHYGSVFRSGLYIGWGMPAAIFGLVQVYNQETRDAIPAWEGLLQIYAAFFVAVLFGMLFQLNLSAFVSARINYEFVMELTKPTLDYRTYLEIPAFFFMTWSYCFFFSFYRVGASHVAPTSWPLAWLVLVCVFFLNPLDVCRRNARYWFLKVMFRVGTPGYSRVEFIAFFVADELCSLVYTAENVYFMGCAYANHWPEDLFQVCPVARQVPYGVFLVLAPIIRLIQCIKRWYDSSLGIHLINAGKYLSVIAQYCVFVVWRSRGSNLHDPAIIGWLIIAVLSSTYVTAWDLIVDWSLFRPKSALLRRDRGYSSVYVYYLAMFTNILIRWEFLWYLPHSQHHIRLRTFFLALAEMLRRWQWNFFRVETEHLGNADAYRVTREIPLPYRTVVNDSEDDDDGPLNQTKKQPGPIGVKLNKLKRHLTGSGETPKQSNQKGSNTEELVATRDYEAGRRLNPVTSIPSETEHEV